MDNQKNGLRVIVAACACCVALFTASTSYACKASGKTCEVTNADMAYCVAQNLTVNGPSPTPTCTYEKYILKSGGGCKLHCN